MMLLALLPLISTALIGSPALDQSRADQLPTMPVKGEEVAVMETSQGQIVLMFYPQKAPKHVENFKMLAKKKFYDGSRFHRTMRDFMIQGGDPNSKILSKPDDWGFGDHLDENGKEVTVPSEFTDLKHTRGILSMARGNDPNSASCQFFIMHADYPGLDGSYSAFGRVVKGLEVVDKIINVSKVPNPRSGSATPETAVVIKTVRIEKWPLKS